MSSLTLPACLPRRIPDGFRRYLLLIGCVLITMPVSVSVYFGNFIIYISSYYHANASSVTVWIDPLWLSSAFKILQPIGMIISGLLERKTTLKIGIVIGALTQSFSVILSYWTVIEPLALLTTFGIMQGIAGGILLALPYKLASEAFLEKRGMAFGILSMGPSFFSLIHMVLAYYLINPNNVITDIEINNIRYFSDSGIIDRVPSSFLKIGLFTAALQLTGLLMIHTKIDNQESPEDDSAESRLLVGSDSNDENMLSDHSVSEKGTNVISTDESEQKGWDDEPRKTRSTGLRNGGVFVQVVPSLGEDTVGFKTNEAEAHSVSSGPHEIPVTLADNTKYVQESNVQIEDYRSDFQIQSSSCKSEFQIEKSSGQNDSDDELSSEKSQDVGRDLNPKEMLTTWNFWKIWLIFALTGHTFFIHLNLYKQFGLTVINDDNTLVMAGTIGTFVLVIFRPAVGFFSDLLGPKPVLAMICACANVFMTMMPISLYTFPPLYIVFVALEFSATSTIKVFYYMVPMVLFGPTHFATNVGLMSASQWVIYFLGPIFVPPLIKSVGWAYVIMSGATAAAIAFFLSLTLPDIKTSKKK